MIARTTIPSARRAGMIVSALAVGALLLTESGASAASEVKYRDGKLWLEVDDIPAAAMFSLVSKTTGMTIVVPDSVAGRRVSVRASGVPLQAAMDGVLRVLGPVSYVIIYGRDGQAGRLIVLDARTERSRHDTAIARVGAEPAATSTSTARSAGGDVAGRSTPGGGAASAAPSRSAASSAGDSVRQQINEWKTLTAAERRGVLQQLQQLPRQDRIEATLRYRHHVLGHPIADEEAYQPSPLLSPQRRSPHPGNK